MPGCNPRLCPMSPLPGPSFGLSCWLDPRTGPSLPVAIFGIFDGSRETPYTWSHGWVPKDTLQGKLQPRQHGRMAPGVFRMGKA